MHRIYMWFWPTLMVAVECTVVVECIVWWHRVL